MYPVFVSHCALLRVYTCVILNTQVSRRSGPKWCGQEFLHLPKTCCLYTLYQDSDISCPNTQNLGFLKLFGQITVGHFHQLKNHVVTTLWFEFWPWSGVFEFFVPVSIWKYGECVVEEESWIGGYRLSYDSCRECDVFGVKTDFKVSVWYEIRLRSQTHWSTLFWCGWHKVSQLRTV